MIGLSPILVSESLRAAHRDTTSAMSLGSNPEGSGTDVTTVTRVKVKFFVDSQALKT